MTDLANTLGSPRGHDEQATYVVSALSSPASADSISDSPELGFDTSSYARAILGDETSSPPASPESRSTRTWQAWHENQNGELSCQGPIAATLGAERSHNYQWISSAAVTVPAQHIWETITEVSGISPTLSKSYGYEIPSPLIFSQAASPVRTSPSPADEQDSQALAPASSTSSPASLSLFDLDGFSSRTFPDCSPRTAVGTSESFLGRWPTSGTAWPGGLSTAVTSECRSDDAGCSSSEPSLSEILEPPQSVAAKYSLSARAASGILRRAEKRGRTLPEHLQTALESVAGHRTPSA